jgi:HD-GYP domain-containing protein (c-di-GMP phosphodiesterase class II)
MPRLSSQLPLERLFFDKPSLRPEPNFVDEPRMAEAMASLRSHPHANRLLEQLWRKDPYTYEHSHRVGNYCQWIAAQMGLSPQERIEAYVCGLLHDVGKIMTPDFVLKKPGPLTPDEFAIIRIHPEDSGKLVAMIPDLGYLAGPVRGHHERIDGKGYPDQKASDKIPLYSRIILVADTFDAMTSNRIYRRKLDLDRTYNELIRCSGTQFDPVCAQAFIAAHQKHAAEIEASRKAA